MGDLTTTNESYPEILVSTLGEYLLDNVKTLRQFYPEFPGGQERLDHPAVTILASDPGFRALMPYPKVRKAVTPINSKNETQWVVGIYDATIQLDLWARSKEERDDTFDAIFNALNPNISPMGLNLVLGDYFTQLCNYLYVGHTIGDAEAAAQRDEWRVTFNLETTCKAIRVREEFIMEDLQTPSEIEADGEITEQTDQGF